MNQVIERLVAIEKKAENSEAKVQEEKFQLRQSYDERKAKYREEKAQAYQAELDHYRQKFLKRRDEEKANLIQHFNQQVDTIKNLVEQKQSTYVNDFMEKVKKLGVKP
ncbi:hypothetical protein ACX3VT_05050 [Aerococcus sanguinicola]|uniref:hypothetical protein n=1 Tax=unclassified Aerococcus TaxID=2618060 RepID=UPI0008A20BDD|nr:MULTISPECIES: hypothetical protein [unclassified Aerococcus]MDK6232774.1 hypothetical protein [Aerococcus sp. UMB10185]MDK6805277.1 hypothetical protein [Aerococcus sp. UMB7834]MDK6854936.1 hypothetical protein [Aerococcus sp. UMB7533]MDK8501798.1 hypothetical protein [Aerococcus sp. UMB1112A]OFN02693.1 hypothetical protein HMPREF2626_01930 [Aerococcus sp. HMSC062A02]